MRINRTITFTAVLLAMIMIFAACGSTGSTDESGSTTEATSPFAGMEPADLSGYDSMSDYDGESRLVETDVNEMVKLINDKETFVVFFSFEECPYCNAIMPYVNKAAEDADMYVGYIDTRSNPEWTNNMEIDGYDKVVKYFGDHLPEDEDGKDHLYTPDMYFIKNGEVVARHDGVVEGADDPTVPLTSSQEENLMKILADDFAKLK